MYFLKQNNFQENTPVVATYNYNLNVIVVLESGTTIHK